MKNIRLVVDNDRKAKQPYFIKNELQTILNLYAKMVSNGEWKDYGLNISKKEVSFNVYHRTSDVPVYKITKNLDAKNKNEKYLIKNSQNQIIKKSESLKSLLAKIVWNKIKLVN